MKTSGWYRLDVSRLVFCQLSLRNDADKGRFLDSLTEALVKCESGMNPLADHLIAEREEFREKMARFGSIGGKISHTSSQPKPPLATLGNGKPALATPSHTDGRNGHTDVKTEDFRTEEFSGDKYQKIQSMPDASLPVFCSRYCGDSEPEKGAGAFRKQLRRIGPEEFRSILLAFVGECESGEEPRNRGSALMARMKAAGAK